MKTKPARRQTGRGASDKAAPVEKATPAKKAARTQNTAPVKKAVSAKKVAPPKKAAPVKEAARAKKPILPNRPAPTEEEISTRSAASPAPAAGGSKAPRASTAPATLTQGRVLAVSGSDSSGGAGLQADIKTITALGGYAMTAVTALTAQNTEGVNGVIETPAGFIAKQMRLVLKDIGADVIKIGMVPNADAVEAVHYTYMEMAANVPIVLDPVMTARGGDPLIDRDAIHLVRQHFLLHARIVTPNLPEAEVLSGMEIRSLDDMKHAAEIMMTLGSRAVLLKGGHFPGEKVYDILYDDDGMEVFEAKRIKTAHMHGTGCALSSGIAISLAQGYSLRDAVVRARDYVYKAIQTAPDYGKGPSPLNYAHTVKADDAGK